MEDLLGEVEPTTVAILGSSGSIGRQGIEVIRAHPGHLRLVGLATGSDAETLLAQAKEFEVPLIGLASGEVEAPEGTSVITGEDAAARVAAESGAQVVLNAVVGAAGLKSTLATIEAGSTLALANKESLVAGGELVMAKASPGQIRPVDSEHSALWQLLEGASAADVRRIYLTGSGGPFRGRKVEELGSVRVDEALAHPVWDMGRKITIDSATLMNKGLEVIEAHFLFGFTYDEIQVVVHPEGRIHAIVELIDGTFLALAAEPDMRLPIQVALGWPERLPSPFRRRDTQDLPDKEPPALTFSRITPTVGAIREKFGHWSFEPPDAETFRCLALAFEAGRKGETFPAVLNAANEVAVAAFLDERLDFLGIPWVIETTLGDHEPLEPRLEGILEADAWARRRAVKAVASRRKP